MNNKNVEFGVFLLSIGMVFLLVNIGVIRWSIVGALFRLWPVILIALGVNIIFKNNTVVRIITWLLFLAAVVLFGYFYPNGFDMSGRGWAFNGNDGVYMIKDLKLSLLRIF